MATVSHDGHKHWPKSNAKCKALIEQGKKPLTERDAPKIVYKKRGRKPKNFVQDTYRDTIVAGYESGGQVFTGTESDDAYEVTTVNLLEPSCIVAAPKGQHDFDDVVEELGIDLSDNPKTYNVVQTPPLAETLNRLFALVPDRPAEFAEILRFTGYVLLPQKDGTFKVAQG